ncbi:unnamed protein product [Rotaria sp. Silwood1]|nr:unnamed protein product [Rotaria sp. Silwood1]
MMLKNVAVSPFTHVFVKSDIKLAVHIMNAVILTTILSAGNSALYFGILLVHWRFRRAFVLRQGYSVFTTHPFNFNNFLAAYITIPVFLIVFLVYRFVKLETRSSSA